MQKLVSIFTLLFLLSFQFLAAQDAGDSLTVNLSELQVTAAQKKLYSEMGRILTVIDKSEIKQSAAQSLDQLLDYVAGVDIRQRGTNSTQADISIRGGSFDQVLVLLNGVNITDPQTGHFNLDIPLNLSDISRVEILEGSAARILGPNAFSGAINIVTENSDKESLTAELTGGSFVTLGQSVSGNFLVDNVQTFASISHSSSNGYMDNTDFNFLNAFVHSSLMTENAGKFELQLAGQMKDFGENGFYSLKFPNQRESTKAFFSSLDWSLNKGNFSFIAQGSWRRHHDRYELDHNAIAGYKYHLTDIVNAKFATSYKSAFGKTTLCFDLRNEHIFSNSMGQAMSSPDSIAVPFEKNIYFKKSYNRSIYSGLLDHSLNLGNWFLSAGIATSYCADFSFSSYGGFDISYAFNKNSKIFVSANSATRLPTFTDLFFVNPTRQGNIYLKPEQSRTIEIGTKINQSQWSLNADIYYRNAENVIDWVKQTATSTKYETMNLSNVNALGTDITVDYFFKNSVFKKISLAYSYLGMDKQTSVFQSLYALDYLRDKIFLKIDHTIWKKLTASWKIGYFDRVGNYDANTSLTNLTAIIKNYTPYALLDTRFLWADKTFDVFLDVNNILNSNYADYGGLTQPGINFNIGVRKGI